MITFFETATNDKQKHHQVFPLFDIQIHLTIIEIQFYNRNIDSAYLHCSYIRVNLYYFCDEYRWILWILNPYLFRNLLRLYRWSIIMFEVHDLSDLQPCDLER